MVEIIIVILMLVLFVILLVITLFSREKDNIKPNQPVQHYYQDGLLNNASNGIASPTYRSAPVSEKNKIGTFDRIISLINNKFHPTSFRNDEECERLLISFLIENLPNNIITHGHTAEGNKLDIVIDGTYALELVVADSEQKLFYLMDLSLKSKKDFDKTASIIIDTGKIDSDKIQEFTNEMKKNGIKTIVIKLNLGFRKKIENRDDKVLPTPSD